MPIQYFWSDKFLLRYYLPSHTLPFPLLRRWRVIADIACIPTEVVDLGVGGDAARSSGELQQVVQVGVHGEEGEPTSGEVAHHRETPSSSGFPGGVGLRDLNGGWSESELGRGSGMGRWSWRRCEEVGDGERKWGRADEREGAMKTGRISGDGAIKWETCQ